MGWDIWLEDACGQADQEWNYTHNCNGMANLALDPSYDQLAVAQEVLFPPKGHKSWWEKLAGLSAEDGAALLDQIITKMESDPPRFKALNPDNGWGSFEGFLAILKEMRDAGREVCPWGRRWGACG